MIALSELAFGHAEIETGHTERRFGHAECSFDLAECSIGHVESVFSRQKPVRRGGMVFPRFWADGRLFRAPGGRL